MALIPPPFICGIIVGRDYADLSFLPITAVDVRPWKVSDLASTEVLLFFYTFCRLLHLCRRRVLIHTGWIHRKPRFYPCSTTVIGSDHQPSTASLHHAAPQLTGLVPLFIPLTYVLFLWFIITSVIYYHSYKLIFPSAGQHPLCSFFFSVKLFNSRQLHFHESEFINLPFNTYTVHFTPEHSKLTLFIQDIYFVC